MAGERSGRRVLVTGAGSGIGRATAERLARGGHVVIGTVRSPEKARRLGDAARVAGLALTYLALDLLSADQIERVASQVAGEGALDVLVNNAGYGVFGAIEDVSALVAAEQFGANLLGPLELTRQLLPTLRRSRGRIIWIGSLAGRQSLGFQGHYSASKAAVAAVSDALRMELRPLGVQVTCVEPGDIATGFTDARRVTAPAVSVYSGRATGCLAAVEREERGAPDPDLVAQAVERLVARRRLPTRVPVGRLGRTTSLFLRIMPHAVGQLAARMKYGI